MSRPRTLITTSVIVAAVAIAATTSPAAAANASSQPSVDATAGLVAKAAPSSASHVIRGAIDGSSILTRSEHLTLTAPTNPSASLVLAPTVEGISPIAVALPGGASFERARIAADGTIIYQSPSTHMDAAVQAKADGTVALHTVLLDAAAPTRSSYKVTGALLQLQVDGSVSLLDPADPSVAEGVIASPWATDAAGVPVPTEYQVHGDTLVQVLHTSGSTVYPVVADPSISFGWKVYVTFNRTEVYNIAHNPVTPKVKYAAIICVMVPLPLVAAGCGLISYDMASSIAGTFATASAQNQCVQIGYPYAAGGLPTSWVILNC